MDVVVADKVEALKKKRMGPPGPCSSRSSSRYSMSRTCGPRDIIFLVIPRLGDNIWLQLGDMLKIFKSYQACLLGPSLNVLK
jgi:hypothetical protein